MIEGIIYKIKVFFFWSKRDQTDICSKSAKTLNRPLRESLHSDKSVGYMGNVACWKKKKKKGCKHGIKTTGN